MLAVQILHDDARLWQDQPARLIDQHGEAPDRPALLPFRRGLRVCDRTRRERRARLVERDQGFPAIGGERVVVERERHLNFPPGAMYSVCGRIWATYRATDYDAQSAGRRVVIRIGEWSAAVDRALSRGRASRAVYVTAWNPQGRKAPRHWNARALARLRVALRAEARSFI